jgi:hypothetical protein
MKCAHCSVEIHSAPEEKYISNDVDGYWFAQVQQCPACKKSIIELVKKKEIKSFPGMYEFVSSYYVRPKSSTRPLPDSEVPTEFADDYVESATVLSDSPKASAALSRRCLQHLLREKAGVKKADLFKEIEEVINSKTLPSHLSEAIDAIRNIGNFAAHPIKSSSTGEILPVEQGEAEWTLDVLDGLFDFYFVQPALLRKKKAALNAKLASAGKPPIK